MKEIGEKLRRARKDKALRMVDVQNKIGISTATLTAIETGKHKNMNANTLRLLAECYGKEIIITFEDK
jgi:cytoskeletal protein RodZ